MTFAPKELPWHFSLHKALHLQRLEGVQSLTVDFTCLTRFEEDSARVGDRVATDTLDVFSSA